MISMSAARRMQESIPVITIFCAVCRRPTRLLSSDYNVCTATRYLEVSCHGHTEVVKIYAEMWVNMAGLPRAFQAEADAIDRLAGEVERIANEDAALAAAGILDLERIRLDNEDAALSACVRDTANDKGNT